MKEGWFASIWDSPVCNPHCGNERPPAQVVLGPPRDGGAGSGDVPKSTVAGSNNYKEVQQLRNDSRNTKEVVLKILCDPWKQRVWSATRYVVRPFEQSFGRWQILGKSGRGRIDLHV
eukprot:5915909-Amphidinium_carterae.1